MPQFSKRTLPLSLRHKIFQRQLDRSLLLQLAKLPQHVAAMAASIPSYRRQHIESNERALRAGFDAAPTGTPAPRAWQEVPA